MRLKLAVRPIFTRKSRWPFICLVLVSALTLSCHKNVQAPDTSKTLTLPAGSTAVITAGNQFAMNFFGTVLQQDTISDNKLISPFSIYMALSMLYNGSAGATRDSMAITLALQGIPTEQLNAVSKALLQQMPSEDSKVSVAIANSLWYRQNGPQPLPAFLDTIGSEYNGHLQALNFSDPASVGTINSWVAGNTDNKIPSILSSLSPDDVMVLVNAIYFNGPWGFYIDPAGTADQPFYLSDGSTVSVPTMAIQGTLRTYHDPAYTLIELPYGSGKNFDMYVSLPANQQQSISSFTSSFNAQSLSNAISHLDSQRVGVLLPKWELTYSVPDMLPNLNALGMGIASGTNADFSNLYSTSTYLSKATHKTYIDVSETGTQAAAATGLTVTISALPATIDIQVNHPFLYFIVEKQTGAILFMGTMNNPSAT
jgi:serine protease inhibitor